MWNISILDNIDFAEKTFAYGNIFDMARCSIHVTVRMVFQFDLSAPIQEIVKNDNDVTVRN